MFSFVLEHVGKSHHHHGNSQYFHAVPQASSRASSQDMASYHRASNRAHYCSWSPQLTQFITPDNPTILRVTHESREEGLKTYRPSFATTSFSRPVVYANRSLDTVSFDWEIANECIKHFSCRWSLRTALEKVKFLTLSNTQFENVLHNWECCLLDKFSELEELHVSGCKISRTSLGCQA